MRKMVVLGMGAAALLATAAFAQDEDNTRVAAVDTSAASFVKLDTDADGRVSAIEAAGDSKVAQSFTAADADKDGYLSKAEFAQLGKSTDRASPEDRTAPPSAPRSDTTQPSDDSTPPK